MSGAVERREMPVGPAVFRCHLCGNTESEVVVALPSRAAEGAAPAAAGSYACTNRQRRIPLQVVACTRCRLRALHPAPADSVVEDAYVAVDDPQYLTIEPQRVMAFKRLVARVALWRRPPGRLLDVGCSTGIFPQVAIDAGWEAYGLEPSRWASDHASRRLPGRITTSFLRDATLNQGSFDVVTAWDVVEHLTDPRGDAEQIKALLRPGGFLFLSTMDSEAPIVRLLGRHWPWYMEMHRFYFTPLTLTRLLAEAGLAVRAIEPYPHYTSLRYLSWKLEEAFGPWARGAGRVASLLGIADRALKVDLGDFFLAVAQRTL